jgi:predicted  nucleic acid-binding Zn-ribbon protein
MNDQQPTNQEILETIQDFSGKTDERFERIEKKLGILKSESGSIKSELGSVKDRVLNIEKTIATQMVTKYYLDDKINDLKSEFIGPIKNEDNKINTLTNKLAIRKVLPTADISEVLATNPFPASR